MHPKIISGHSCFSYYATDYMNLNKKSSGEEATGDEAQINIMAT